MSDHENIEIRSEEVQEFLGTPPGWMLRWGSTMILATVVMLGYLSWWVKYPDTVEAKIRITTFDPPKKIFAENSEYLSHLLVANDDTIKRNAIIGVYENPADFQDILVLEDQLNNIDISIDLTELLAFQPARNLMLGSLQENYSRLLTELGQYSLLSRFNTGMISSNQNRSSIERLQAGIASNNDKIRQIDVQLNVLRKNQKKYQDLANTKYVPRRKLEELYSQISRLEQEKIGINSTIRMIEAEIAGITGEISNARTENKENTSSSQILLREYFDQLKNAIQKWKSENLVTSPIRGVVSFTNTFLAEQSYVEKGTELLVILPLTETEIVGIIDLPVSGSGKVKNEQKAIIKMHGYPALDFGTITGQIVRKGKIASEGVIPVEVTFPQGLMTSRNLELPFEQEMTGTAEIITDEKRFIERIFDKFRSM
ncbi:MAG: HlyD family efflux transporter periplasmic adaptor subunit [Bacteroidetes bacterium]|nr:HlyD family efflux transporter periplasmic adaptor subunit [Bacteroidota bacterium]